MTKLNAVGDPQVEVGEIWEFQNAFEGGKPDRYLVLKEVKDTNWVNTFCCLHIESGEIIPDLIIDNGTVHTYHARRIA